MSDLAVEPMMEIFDALFSANMEGFMREGSVPRESFVAVEGVEAAVGGRRTEVMMMCGVRCVRCRVEIAEAREG